MPVTGAPRERMMTAPRITVLQLARFGDVVQTSPLLRLLRQCVPDAELTLVVDQRVEEIAGQLHGVDVVVGVDLATLPWRPGVPLSEALASVQDRLRPLAKGPPADALVVLNQEVIAGALAEWIPARHRFGPRLRQPLPAPHAYLTASTRDRRFSPLHLSEVWAAYVWPMIEALADEFAVMDVRRDGEAPLIPAPRLGAAALGPGLAILGREGNSGSLKPKRYAVNLGAGAAGRRLPAATVAALISRMDRSDEMVLLGLPTDIPLARQVAGQLTSAQRPRIVDLTGRTALRELPGVLAGCDVLISGDTGTLQLAAATRTPSVGIFHAGANPVETGAYADGAVAIVHRNTLAGNEDLADSAELPSIMRIHTLARALAEGRTVPEAIPDAEDNHAVLVARTDDVGVRYSPGGQQDRVALGAGERWTPVLRHLLHGTGSPRARHSFDRRSGRLHAEAERGVVATLTGEHAVAGDEKRWLDEVLSAMGTTIHETVAGSRPVR